ncbi:MAG: LysE family transporter, partial [Bdellovibrionales bacterium]
TITEVIQTYSNPLHIVGGVLVLFIAWHAWRDKPRQADTKEVERKYLKRAHLKLGGAVKAWATSFVITLTNPATLFGVLAVVATLGGMKSSTEAYAIIGGIFLGSSLWWLILSGGVSLLRGHFTEERVMVLNKVTSGALTLFGLWILGMGVVRMAA